MSDMLEKAIIDASALKEAAVRNAENLVLERYSNQIKEAVGSLLEQEDPMADPTVDPTVDPTAGLMAGESEGPSQLPVMEHIPLAVTSENVDEEIEIPLEQLMEQITQLSETMRFDGDFIDDVDIQENPLLEAVQEDLEEIILHADDDDDDDAVPDKEGLEEEILPELEEELLGEKDDVVLDEEDLEEALEEALVVDINPRKSGWAGTPESVINLAEEELLALEQDSERREHNQAVRKAVKQLENVNESLTKQNTQFRTALKSSKKQMIKFGQAVLTLKEKLDEVSLTNARLLYQNKALSITSLNERQKRKLVEAVSRADTVEEAKVIFETLEGTVGSTSRKSQPKSLGEAVEKSSSMILSNRKRDTVRQKANPTYNRWKSLAGLDPLQD